MHKIVCFLKNHYYICYTLIFVIMCIAVFGIFWYNGKSFVWKPDGLSQHYTAYLYYGRYLRTIVRSILFDHSFTIPSFSMSIGYGSDILTTLSYYVIGDPICALTMFVPSRYMIYFYNFSVLLRLYLSGITFSKLCFYINHKKEIQYSMTAIIIGTFIYVFCGFALFASVRHPYFINPMIYFPLVLLGVEMILDKEKPYILITGVFLSAISNFYFFYMIVILTVLYVAWRLVFVYHRTEIKDALYSLGGIAVYSLLGTAMSAVILVPTILLFFGDTRSESGYMHTLFYTLADYQKSISSFIAVNTDHDWLHLGYAAVALIAVFLLFMQKGKYKDIKVAFVVMVIMASIPLIGSFMNGFSYVSNRWVWGFSLLVGYIVVIMWDQLLSVNSQTKLKLVLCLSGYFVLCLFMTKSRTRDFYVPMIIAFIFMCFLVFRKGRYQAIFTSACILSIFVNIIINANFMYSPRFNDYISEFADNKDFIDNYGKTEIYALNELVEEEDNSFNRYTGSITTNRTLYTGLHSTQYFWSLANGFITDYQKENGLNFGISFKYVGLDSRADLTTLANVKYFVKKEDDDVSVPPYAFESIGTGTDEKLSDYLKRKLGKDYDVSALSKEEKQDLTDEYLTTYEIYENEDVLPFGYTYSDYITRESYDELSPIQKQETMMQAVVLEDSAEINEITPLITSSGISYTVDKLDGVQWEDNQIVVFEEDGKATLTFSGIGNSENYLYIKGLNYSGVSPKDQYTDLEWSLQSSYDKNAVKYEERFWEEPTRVDLNLSSKNAENEKISTSITYNTPYYSWYSNQHNYLISLYYDESPRQSITITFPTTGVYTFDDIEVLCQPMDNYEEQIDALKVDTLENVDFHDDNAAFATNEVTGEISLDQEKYLLLTIPYSSGWEAYVDGEEQELLQANTMYMALQLEPGDHDIELKYHTPGKTVGLCVSIVSFVIFIVLCIFMEKGKDTGIRDRRRRKRL